MYSRIVVPLDGSEVAERALPEAEKLALLTGAPLHLVRIVSLAAPGSYGAFLALETAGYAEALAAAETETTKYLLSKRRNLTDRGLATVTIEQRRGEPAREIATIAQPGDLLVMATHGRSGVQRLVMGSVAETVVCHARVPVLLVPACGVQWPRKPETKLAAAAGFGPW